MGEEGRLLGVSRIGRGLLVVGLALVASGCALVPKEPLVHQPMTARAEPFNEGRVRNPGGSLYVGGGHGIALFEDRRPRNVGDILTIVVSEKINATKNSGANASRDASTSAAFSVVPKMLGGLLRNQDAELSGKTGLNAKGGASAANTFNGVITVTVTDVLPNGNLLVSGEKQMGINQGTEFIRFSGVVNPRTVTGNNTVQSTQVADARIEYTAKGYIDEAQQMGWLQRVFLNVLPY
jgi:flagellar L-ring protein precursor FlgH